MGSYQNPYLAVRLKRVVGVRPICHMWENNSQPMYLIYFDAWIIPKVFLMPKSLAEGYWIRYYQIALAVSILFFSHYLSSHYTSNRYWMVLLGITHSSTCGSGGRYGWRWRRDSPCPRLDRLARNQSFLSHAKDQVISTRKLYKYFDGSKDHTNAWMAL